MNPMTLRLTRSAKTWLVPSLYVLALACGGANEAALGDKEQAFTADDDDTDAAADACEGGTPARGPFGPDCQVIAQGLCFSTADAACACAGCALEQCAIAESFPAQAFCSPADGSNGSDPDAPVSSGPIGGGTNGSVGGGTSGAAGASNDPGFACGEPGQTDPSAPSAPACEGGRPRDPSDQRCDFVVGGSCFDDAEEACACAGCGLEVCLVLESYPAQIACP